MSEHQIEADEYRLLGVEAATAAWHKVKRYLADRREMLIEQLIAPSDAIETAGIRQAIREVDAALAALDPRERADVDDETVSYT